MATYFSTMPARWRSVESSYAIGPLEPGTLDPDPRPRGATKEPPTGASPFNGGQESLIFNLDWGNQERY